MTTPTQNALEWMRNLIKESHQDSAYLQNGMPVAIGREITQSLQTLEALMPLVEELVSVREKATEGEWSVDYKGNEHFLRGVYDDDENLVAETHGSFDACEVNAQFIATAANISNKIKEIITGGKP